jgi:signal transduction histidine kinase
MAKARISTLLTFSLLHMGLNAQPWQQVIRYDADRGLPQNSVWSMHTDPLGRLWYACTGSVGYWDGYLKQQPIPFASQVPLRMKSNRFGLFEDKQGRLWISHDNGLLKYDAYTGQFGEAIAGAGQINIIGELGGGLLLRTEKHGLTRVLRLPSGAYLQEKALKNQLPPPESFSAGKSAMVGTCFLMPYSKSSLLVFDTTTAEGYLQAIHKDVSGVFQLGKDSAVCFQGDSSMLFTWHQGKLRIRRLSIRIHGNQQPLDLVAYQGRWLLGGQFGLCFLNRNTLQVEALYPSPDPSEKESVFVFCLHLDRNGNLFIGTNTNGIYQVSPYRNRFGISAIGGIVKCISSLPDGRVIAGRYGSGELEVSGPNGVSRLPVVQPMVQGAPNSIWGVHAQDETAIWIVDETRLQCYNLRSREWRFRKTISDGPCLHYPVFREYAGSLWVNLSNGKGSGLCRVGISGTIDTLFYLPGEDITCYQPLSGPEWLYGTRKGLYLRQTDGTQRLLLPGWIKSIHRSKSGLIYVATTGGVFTFNEPRSEKLKPLTHLPDPFVYGILEDERGQIWFSTNSGLYRLNPLNGIWSAFHVSDGLPSNEFNTGAYHRDRAGNLYFGSVKGWCSIAARGFAENRKLPAVWLKAFLVNEKAYASDTLSAFWGSITLPHQQNNLAFSLEAIDLSIPEKNRLRYKLDGHDPDWILTDAEAVLRYARLAPGSYKLRVQGIGSDGQYGAEFTLPINIRPPFWQTWWFYGLVFIALMLFFWLLIRWWLLRQKRRVETELRILRQVEAERARISRDLHDHAGSQLSMLLSNIEKLRAEPDGIPDQALETLEETGREAMQTLRESIWAMNHEQLSFTALADRFKSYARRMAASKGQVQVEFSESIASDPLLPAQRSLHLFRLCQEAFHNACKHSKAASIVVRFTDSDGFVEVAIEDDGCGFDASAALRQDAYGLKNMQTSVQLKTASVSR